MCQAQAPISPIIHIHIAQYAALVTITNVIEHRRILASLLTFVTTFFLQTKVLTGLNAVNAITQRGGLNMHVLVNLSKI